MARAVTPTFTPPGPGRWNLEVSHFNGRFTVAYRDVYQRGQHDGMKATMARYGAPASHMAVEFVNDRPYMRMVPLMQPPGKLGARQPPALMVWLLARLHPGFRRRNRAARRVFATRLWRDDAQRWYEEQKPMAIAANLALQDEDVVSYTDVELAAHLDRAVDNVYRGVRLHFELVGANALPVGDLLVAMERWGFGLDEALRLLAGASPSSADTARLLASGGTEEYLRHYRWRAVANYDVDSPTIGEMPAVVEATVRAVRDRPHAGAAAPVDEFRARVPPAERPRFDELVAEARAAYGVRDDNAGITLQWTVGLFRRALLEAGRRLALDAVEDVFELTPVETAARLRGATKPSSTAAAARRDGRRMNNALDAPRTLGPEDAIPPLDPMPPPLRRVSAALIIQMPLMYTNEDRPPMAGTGIGDRVVTGRACVARSPEEAFDRLEAGDILVAPMTTPAYDAVLPIVAALVVEEGGALSHAAIVAREFGLPAVIGARGALDRIVDGDKVEVDPITGTVRVLN